jgi:condensin complex subunit 3
VPAVKRKELVIREKGLVCLGLCCLIARRMALNSFQLFLSQVQSAPEVLKLRVLQVVFDVLMVHEGDFLANASVGVRWVLLPLVLSLWIDSSMSMTGRASDRIFATGSWERGIGQGSSADLHWIRKAHALRDDFRRAGMCFLSMFILKTLTDLQVLVSLALIYLSPDTAENQELRQSLSYFFPAYSYSSPGHQRLMQKVGGHVVLPPQAITALCT